MTDPGQRILPGGGPLLPPMPLPPELPADDFPCCTHRCEMPACGMEGDDCKRHLKWADLFGAAPGMTAEQFGVESPDLPIPAEARKAVSEALDGHIMGWHGAKGPACGCGWHPTRVHWAAEHRDHVVEALLAAALPHLRSLQVETQLEFGRALGRREAGEQVVEAFLNAARGDETGLYLDIDTACALAREAAKGDPNG